MGYPWKKGRLDGSTLSSASHYEARLDLSVSSVQAMIPIETRALMVNAIQSCLGSLSPMDQWLLRHGCP